MGEFEYSVDECQRVVNACNHLVKKHPWVELGGCLRAWEQRLQQALTRERRARKVAGWTRYLDCAVPKPSVAIQLLNSAIEPLAYATAKHLVFDMDFYTRRNVTELWQIVEALEKTPYKHEYGIAYDYLQTILEQGDICPDCGLPMDDHYYIRGDECNPPDYVCPNVPDYDPVGEFFK